MQVTRAKERVAQCQEAHDAKKMQISTLQTDVSEQLCRKAAPPASAALFRSACPVQLEEVRAKAALFTFQELGTHEVPRIDKKHNAEYFKAKVTGLQQQQVRVLARGWGQGLPSRDQQEAGLKSIPADRRTEVAALARVTQAQNVYNEKAQTVLTVQQNKEKMEKDVKERVRKWKRFRDEISKTTNRFFKAILNRKNQDGEVCG
jgi:hypothetical protein